MTKQSVETLIVGGGPAGLAAALAAAARAKSVAIIDDNPHLGGQIWRSELGNVKSPQATRIVNKISSGQVQIINNAQVFTTAGARRLLAETPGGVVELNYEKLIIATGARERFLPFPGWTLPNVFGAGGLQALIKGGLKIENKRIIVAGTGPLLLAVADYANVKGAKVLLIAEQTSGAQIRRFARGLWRQPTKMIDAAALRARLIGIPYRTGCWVTECRSERVSKGVQTAPISVDIFRKGKTQTFDCDYLACGFHLVPNLELAELLSCNIDDGFVTVDKFQQTSVENVFCAGEPTGIAGVESSLVEGTIAGLAAIGQFDAAGTHFAKRDAARRFGGAMNAAFLLRSELRSLADAATIICRCEDVERGMLAEFSSFREAKLQTRCGMGACQGRVCGAATEFLFGWERPNVRPPIFPVRMENL